MDKEQESWTDKTTEEIDDVIDEQLDRAFHNPTHQIVLHDVARIATDFDPIDLAHAVTRLPAKARWIVYDNLPDVEAKIVFITNTGRNTRANIFKQLSNKEIATLIAKMPSDEGVEVLEDLAERRIRRVIELLEPKKAKSIRELQAHGRLTAGRLMTNEVFSFTLNRTIGEVRKEIRNNPGIDVVSRIFVIDQDRTLIGFVPDRSLIVNPEDVVLKQIMAPVQHMVAPDTDRDDVVDLVERYSISALPVVDENERLLGVIDYEDAVEAMRDIADETIASIGGTAEKISEDEPTINRMLYRTPWLFVTLLAGMTTSTVMTKFKGQSWFEFAPFFVPLIAMMSGNVGIQCSTILVRWMSQGEFSKETKRDAVFGEILVGGGLGLAFACVCALFIWVLSTLGFYNLGEDHLLMTCMVSIGLFVACCAASILGTLSPILFDSWDIDPAVASGPIVAAFNDVMSATLFTFVAYTVYHLFM